MTGEASVEGDFALDEFELGANSQFQSVSAAQQNYGQPDPLPDSVRGGLHCPVHGEIILPEELQPLLSAKPLRRLRRLQQLGACSVVRLCLRVVSPLQNGVEPARARRFHVQR